jgi:uncharacterized protein YggE
MCLLVLVLLASCAPQREMQLIQAEQRSISVSGHGEVKVSPDVAQIIFLIRTQNRDIPIAEESNRKISAKVRAALKQFNIKNSDIKTEYLNITPERPGIATLYNARTAIQATVYDLDKIEDILTSVLKINTVDVKGVYFEIAVQGVYFQVSNLEYHKEQARSMALQDAKIKAATMAEQLEQETGDPISIQEFPVYPAINLYGFTSALVVNQERAYLNLSGENTVVFGQITIGSNVTVEFSLK